MIGERCKEVDIDFTTLVVQAEADDDGRVRVELALGLALQFETILAGVAARDLIPLMTVPGASTGIGTLLEEHEIRAGLDAAERQFRTQAGATHARIACRSMIADLVAMLAGEARTARPGRRRAEAGTRRRQLVRARGPEPCPHAGRSADSRRAARPVVSHLLDARGQHPRAPGVRRCERAGAVEIVRDVVAPGIEAARN